MTADAAGPPSPDPAERRICDVLLVEDHADTAMVISLLLKKFGHRVRTAASIAEGVQQFDGDTCDIILSDLGLPDGSGIDFIRQIRQRSRVPAVALTGYGMEDDLRSCRDAGFDAHLTKPVNFAELDTLIRRLTTPGV